MMVYRHFVFKHSSGWMAFDETDSCIGTYSTRRDALKCVKARFDGLGDEYILNFDEAIA